MMVRLRTPLGTFLRIPLRCLQWKLLRTHLSVEAQVGLLKYLYFGQFVEHFVHFCKWPQNGISEDPYIPILTTFVYGGSQNT